MNKLGDSSCSWYFLAKVQSLAICAKLMELLHYIAIFLTMGSIQKYFTGFGTLAIYFTLNPWQASARDLNVGGNRMVTVLHNLFFPDHVKVQSSVTALA